MSGRICNRHGFTLIEVLAAMGVLMLLGILLGTTSAAFMNGFEQTGSAAARLEDRMNIDRVMDNLVRATVPFRWEDDNFSSRLLFNGQSDELFFTALRRSYGQEKGALIFCRLFLRDGNLVAQYSFYPRLPWEEWNDQKMEEEIIASNISGIRFLYGFVEDDEIRWEEEYLEEDHQIVPLALQITVEWQNRSTDVWLRRTAGNSGQRRLGNPDLYENTELSGGF